MVIDKNEHIVNVTLNSKKVQRIDNFNYLGSNKYTGARKQDPMKQYDALYLKERDK